MKKRSGFKPPDDPETVRMLKDPDKARSYWRGVEQVESWLSGAKPKGIKGGSKCP